MDDPLRVDNLDTVGSTEPTKVVILDSNELSREGLARLLDDSLGFSVVAKCADQESLLESVTSVRPDLVLIKLGSPPFDTITSIRAICKASPRTKIAILSEHASHIEAWTAIEAGAGGYLGKADIGITDLVTSIELLLKGMVVMTEDIARTPVRAQVQVEDKGQELSNGCGLLSALSKREQEIVALLPSGATNAEIAKALFLEESTVKVHMRNILEKLGFRNRQQVVAFAVSQAPSLYGYGSPSESESHDHTPVGGVSSSP